MQKIKCVVVGDDGVGKTSLLVTYRTDVFPGTSVPPSVQHFTANMMMENTPVSLELWDTIAGDEQKMQRKEIYSETDVFLVCFSLVDRESLNDISRKWVKEIKEHCSTTPFVVVGLKEDLKSERGTTEATVSFEEAEQMSKRLGAVRYLECSALIHKHLAEVFEKAANAGLHHK